MEIYIKPVKETNLTGRTELFVGDAAEVVAPSGSVDEIKGIRLLKISTTEKKKNYLISCTDIVKAVTGAYPGASVRILGETDTVVQYAACKSKPCAALTWLRVAFVAAMLVTGSATAIMSFHTDAQLSKVFENYCRIFYGEGKVSPLVIEIPYSIGIAAGITVFYNHFMGRKLTDDPTPIEVEMSQYEAEVNDTRVDLLNSERNGGGNG